MLKAEKWFDYGFDGGCTTTKEYEQFQRDCKSDLKKMASENGLELYDFNKNHFCFSAVLSDGEKFIYVSVSDVRYFGWNSGTRILIRTMKHAKDWSGGMNQYCTWNRVGEFARKLMDSDYAR